MAHVAQELKRPVLLWGPIDDGDRSDWAQVTDRQCGLFATSKVLHHFGVPFTYIVNCHLTAPEFSQGFGNFLGTANIVKRLRHLKIGQVDTRPSPFLTMMANETELLEKFGIRIVPTSLAHIIADAQELEGTPQHEAEMESFQARIPQWQPDPIKTSRIAALKLALKNWATTQGCDALVIQCWSALQRTYGIFPCFVNAELTAEGLPVGCAGRSHRQCPWYISSKAKTRLGPPGGDCC